MKKRIAGLFQVLALLIAAVFIIATIMFSVASFTGIVTYWQGQFEINKWAVYAPAIQFVTTMVVLAFCLVGVSREFRCVVRELKEQIR